MSADTTSESVAASKPLLTLLDTPTVTESGDEPAASKCCGGGSCSL